jgi:hypothetical protein
VVALVREGGGSVLLVEDPVEVAVVVVAVLDVGAVGAGDLVDAAVVVAGPGDRRACGGV